MQWVPSFENTRFWTSTDGEHLNRSVLAPPRADLRLPRAEGAGVTSGASVNRAVVDGSSEGGADCHSGQEAGI